MQVPTTPVDQNLVEVLSGRMFGAALTRAVEDKEREIVEFASPSLRRFLAILQEVLSRQFLNLNYFQMIGLASLSKAVSIASSAQILLDSGDLRNLGLLSRVITELAHKLDWLLSDKVDRQLHLDLLRLQRARDQRRAIEGVAKTSAVQGGDLDDYIDRKALAVRLKESIEEEAAIRKRIETNHGKVVALHQIGIEGVFAKVGGADTYSNLYRYLSTQEHAELIHLEMFVEGESNGPMTFWPPRSDGLEVANYLTVYSYLVAIAARAWKEIGSQTLELEREILAQEDLVLRMQEAVLQLRDQKFGSSSQNG